MPGADEAPTVSHAVAQPLARPVPPPMSLTASDGSGLRLTRLDAKAVVEGPLAFTELHLYFHNPEDRIREGTFSITLPPGASVSRFAMQIDGRWQEAEVVEKATARLVYEDFLHRKQDPALLEKAPGNQFTARVFPIPERGDKHLVISYSQALAGKAYVLPLVGLPRVGRVDARLMARLAGARDETLAERNWQPDRDFVAGVPTKSGAIGAGDLVVSAVEVGDSSIVLREDDEPRQLTLLVDTSASRALDFVGYVRSIGALIAALREQYGDDIELQVLAFDQDTQRIFAGRASDYGVAEHEALVARGAAGASDLGQALEVLANSPLSSHARVAIVTDGVMTAGPGTAELATVIGRLPIDRLDVIVSGGLRDEKLAHAISRAARLRGGDVHDLDRSVDDVAIGLGEPVHLDVAIDVPGALWFHPRTIPAARSHSSVMVYARMAQPTSTVQIHVGDAKRVLAVTPSTPALVERAVASTEIEELEAQLAVMTDPAAAKALEATIAKRSVEARLISTQASMLVLETEEDYARYQIARTALADILVVGAHGLEQTRRSEIVADKRKAKPVEAEERLVNTPNGMRLMGAGGGGGGTGWGTIGTGSYGTVGYGSASGTAYRARSASVPAVTIGQPVAMGDLDKISIRRYIKRALPRVRYCYERELLGRPTLAGTIAVTFMIEATGKVSSASASGFDATVATCIADVMRSVEFPAWQAGGGRVQVNYPFTFYTEESVARERAATAAAARAARPPGAPAAPAPATPPTHAAAATPGAAAATIDEPAPAVSTAAAPVSAPAPATSSHSEPTPVIEPAALPDPEAAHAAATRARNPRRVTRAEQAGPAPLTGTFAKVMRALQQRKTDEALAIARTWHADAPGDVLALVALGEVLEAKGDPATAARMYGSIIDLFSSRADLRRFAGERLERLGGRSRKLVIDTYRRAVADRPDHPSGHRLLAYALARAEDYEGAFVAILAGVDGKHPDDRFAGVDRVLGDDAGMIGAAYIAHGGSRAVVMRALAKRKLALAVQSSTRFIMYWETDANDVDFHIRDARGGHAFYSQKALPSGGELYADVTTGYGPECFAIQGKPSAGPYRLSINYYSRGPMGYGMGLLEVQRFDGKSFTFEERPFVIMTDHSFVDLGSFR